MSHAAAREKEASATVAGSSMIGMRLELASALPFVEVETFKAADARAISEAYHLAIALIDELYPVTSEARVALAKVVVSIARSRLPDDGDVADQRVVEEMANEAFDILTGLRPLPISS